MPIAPEERTPLFQVILQILRRSEKSADYMENTKLEIWFGTLTCDPQSLSHARNPGAAKNLHFIHAMPDVITVFMRQSEHF